LSIATLRNGIIKVFHLSLIKEEVMPKVSIRPNIPKIG